ncbi:MAG: hypothetical protein LBK52_00460 [Deltaproteobacteria bacterium]|jgi:hypothetical protein|nr:hypothetical protein [Deltaproteobacteria bacterium]
MKIHILGIILVAALLRLFAYQTQTMPLGLFLVWMLGTALPISLISMHGAAVRRTRLAHTFDRQGTVYRLLSYGFWTNIFLFLTGLTVSFFMLINLAMVQGWDWIWIGLTFPMFFLVRFLIPKRLIQESVAWLRPARTNFWAVVLTPVLLSGLRFAVLLVFGEAADPADEVLLQPFRNSPSVFLQTAGEWALLFGTFSREAFRIVLDFSQILAVIMKTVNSFCLYGGFLAVLAFLILPAGEWRRSFVPPAESETVPPVSVPVAALYFALLSVFLVMAYIPLAGWLEVYFAGPKGDSIRQLRAELKDRGTRLFWVIEGRYYDPQVIDELKKLAAAANQSVILDAEGLRQKANHIFNSYKANVDDYLDWYYSLSGEYARLYQAVRGNAEQYLAGRAAVLLGGKVDAASFQKDFEALQNKIASLKDTVQAQFEAAAGRYEVAAVQVSGARLENLTLDKIVEEMIPIETITFGRRLAVSGVTAAGSGVFVGAVVKKLVQKALFKLAAKALAKAAVSKGVSAAGGAAAGAAVGSVVPGPGTAAGAALGAAFGLIGGFIAEKMLLKLEEAVSREEFKREIINAIDAQRLEVLKVLQFQPEPVPWPPGLNGAGLKSVP